MTGRAPGTGGGPPGDPRLRELFQRLPLRRAPGEECPEPAELWDSARGEVDPGRHRWLIGHTGRCPSCAEDWRLARHLERGEAAPAAAARPVAGPARFQRFALAATVILAVAVAALWTARVVVEPEPPVERSGDRPAIEALTPEDRPLSREAPVLRWRGPAGARDARYEVTVTTGQAWPVARAERLEESEYRLPSEVVDGLPPGTELRWQVEATLPDGSRHRSKAYRVHLE